METTTIAAELRYLMRKTPFEPFRIHRQDGQSFLVPSGGWLLITDDYIVVGVAKSRRSEVADKFMRIPMSEVTGAEIVKHASKRKR